MHNLDDLVLVPASEKQTLIALKQRFDPDGPISLDDHIERAKILGECEYAKGKQVYWALVPKDAQDTEHILSSVATIERSIILQTTCGQEPTSHLAFSITHVFTPKELRRRGYATRMMTLLHNCISERAPHDHLPMRGILSFLYSGAGEFYTKCGSPGWSILPSTETYWSVDEVLSHDIAANNVLQPVPEDAFEKVAQSDCLLLQQELSGPISENGRMFAVQPNGSTFTWLIARSKFYGQRLSSVSLPTHWGVRVAVNGDEKCKAFAIWFIDYVKKELHILRLRCPPSEEQLFIFILHVAAMEARDRGCSRILAWNLPNDLLNICTPWTRQTQPRTKNLPCVAWYGNGECPKWLANEKYGWC